MKPLSLRIIAILGLALGLAGCSPKPAQAEKPAAKPAPPVARVMCIGNAPAGLTAEDQLRYVVLKQLAKQQDQINSLLPEERRDGAFYFAVDGRDTPPSPALLNSLRKIPSTIPQKSRTDCELPDGICVANGTIRKGAILWISKLQPKPDGSLEFTAGSYRHAGGILSEKLCARPENGVWTVTH